MSSWIPWVTNDSQKGQRKARSQDSCKVSQAHITINGMAHDLSIKACYSYIASLLCYDPVPEYKLLDNTTTH